MAAAVLAGAPLFAGEAEDGVAAVAAYAAKESPAKDGGKPGPPPGAETITWRQVSRKAAPEMSRLAATLTGLALQRRQGEVRRETLESLVDQALMRQAAREAGLQVSDEEIRGQIRSRMMDLHRQGRLKSPDERVFAEQLELEGLSLAELREEYRAQILRRRYLDQVVKPSPPPSPGEVLRYYQEHLAEFASPQEVQLRQIVLRKDRFASRAEAEARLRELWSDIQSGADFGELARRHSDSAYARDGGLFPYQSVASLRADLQELVRGAPAGRTLAVLEMPESFAIVRVDGVRQGSPRAGDEVQAEILERIQDADRQRREKRVAALLRQRAYVWFAE